ncbi:NAD(P)H oxidoreductase RTN4IP1, mitochondrial-like [Arctopsyche grandis]|uniref:NAD(P)H oxidoreductase RTN4IP1, mitochondrial-like n=1 Tax=Arctopsyche grandis TaxID=121162 RepID=UPI00406D7B9A
MVMGASRWATTLRAAARQVGCSTPRQSSSAAALPLANARDKMSAWQIHSYGDLSELQLSPQTRIPHIAHPNQVLIKVEAASVNPIDVAMIGGYGATALNLMRHIDNVEFPLTLGRDFCGKIVSKGLGEYNKLPVGSRVWGVVPVHQQGSHAEYVVVDANMISEIPNNINTQEAASMLYTALTAWSGLMFSANLKLHGMTGLKALVLGASGGVGNAAVQMLIAGGAKVGCTCSTDAIPLVESFGPECVLDYSSPEFHQKLADLGRFDVIVDCAGLGSDYAMKNKLQFRNYVTFTTPVLKNMDNLGLVRGFVTTVSDLICPNIMSMKNGGLITWAYFTPSSEGIKHVYDLVSSKSMVPIVENVFEFKDTPSAYKRVQDGHLRGKVVINLGESI